MAFFASYMNEHHIKDSTAIPEEEAARRFSRVFASTKDRLHNFVWKLTRNEADTKDILQNCYLRLWQNIARVDMEQDAAPLLFTYARNLVIDHWRKHAGRQESLAVTAEGSHRPVEESMEYKDRLQQLEAGIAQLPARRQHIFKLVKEEGLSHKTVARELGISPATVEKQVVLSLRFLKKSLDL